MWYLERYHAISISDANVYRISQAKPPVAATGGTGVVGSGVSVGVGIVWAGLGAPSGGSWASDAEIEAREMNVAASSVLTPAPETKRVVLVIVLLPESI